MEYCTIRYVSLVIMILRSYITKTVEYGTQYAVFFGKCYSYGTVQYIFDRKCEDITVNNDTVRTVLGFAHCG